MHPEIPILISCGVGAIGLIGIMAGMIARNGVAREKKLLAKGEAQCQDLGATGGRDRHLPHEWLKSTGLPADSHFGDRLISVWKGWRAGRVPPLIELHSVSAGRERRRLTARMAGGITGLLVVSGIAGTLICIHPILDGFNISADKKGVVDTGERTKNATEMIQSLGRAFWPSLTALLVTFLVASTRGVYQHAASKLAWDLDRFTVDVLFHIFPEPIPEREIAELRAKLANLADQMKDRDESLGKLVDKLDSKIDGLRLSEDNLASAVVSIAAAAAGMANEGAQVRAGFIAHLGENSPAIKGLGAITAAAQDNATIAEQLHQSGRTLSEAAASALGELHYARQRLDQSLADGRKHLVETNKKAADVAAAKVTEAGAAAAASLHRSVAEAPKFITASMERATTRMEQAFRNFSNAAAAEPESDAPVNHDLRSVQDIVDSTGVELDQAHENARQSTWSAEALLEEGTQAAEAASRKREQESRPYVPPVLPSVPETLRYSTPQTTVVSNPARSVKGPLLDFGPRLPKQAPPPEKKKGMVGRIFGWIRGR